jgi:hypothetical protein
MKLANPGQVQMNQRARGGCNGAGVPAAGEDERMEQRARGRCRCHRRAQSGVGEASELGRLRMELEGPGGCR